MRWPGFADAMAEGKPPPALRDGFAHFQDVPTRWHDNDVYAHVNNTVYYAYFDTVINRFLIDRGGLDFRAGEIVGLAVETMCRFRGSFAFPETIEAGLRVGHLGSSSVRYELGLFGTGEATARAEGHFVHVFVERKTQRPVPIPAALRAALETLRR
jgi:acyl-CoA thioester hydrolase